MVSLAANWSTVPDKSSCTIERIGVRKYVENFLFRLSKKFGYNCLYDKYLYFVFCLIRSSRSWMFIVRQEVHFLSGFSNFLLYMLT